MCVCVCVFVLESVRVLTTKLCFCSVRTIQKASSAIFLAARDFGIALPMAPRPWWQVFLGTNDNKGKDLAEVANAILGTYKNKLVVVVQQEQKDLSNDVIDWLIATKGFVRPLVPDGKAFNDSESFLWFYYKDFFEKEMQQNE